MERCEECGFEPRLEEAFVSGSVIIDTAGEIASLMRTGTAHGMRRDPSVWSPLEYCCHLRDMLLVQRERVLLARREDGPSAFTMGREERVEHDGYAEQSPEDVVRQMVDAAQMFAHVLSRLEDRDWNRRMVYHYPFTAERSLRWVAVRTEHELRHHLLDIQRQLS